MIVQQSNYFYISELNNYYISNNKYIDIKYCIANVSFVETKMIFDFKFYVANNFKLPSDSIRLSMVLPSQEISNILVIPSNETINVNNSLIDSSKTKIFKSRVIVDISEDNYFLNLYQNSQIPIKLFFSIDSNSISNNSINVKEEAFIQFVSEINSLVINLSLYYKNFTHIKDNEYLDHFYESKLDNLETRNILKSDQLLFSLLPNKDVNTPFKNFFKINSENNELIEIKNCEIFLSYKDKNGDKTIDLKLNRNLFFENKFIFELDYELDYIFSKKEYQFKQGNNGISFIYNTEVNYKIYFDLSIKGKTNKYLIENNFNWKIDELNNYKILERKEKLNNYETILEK